MKIEGAKIGFERRAGGGQTLRMRNFVPLGAALIFCAAAFCFPEAARAESVKVIFDTDMCGDCDDAGALAVLNKMADAGRAELLACLANTHDKDKAIAATISAINTYYGRPDVPIGAYHGPLHPAGGSTYDVKVRDEFPHSAPPDDQTPDAVGVYRKALAAAPDRSVVIVSTGFLCNLHELLESKADTASTLSGWDLTRQKVKLVVAMGGGYPQSGGECNFSSADCWRDTQFVLDNWPTPMLFSGFEIGSGITTGKCLKDAPDVDPVKRIYGIVTGFGGRPSWDLTAALAATGDLNRYWDVSPSGYVRILPGGGDQWYSAPDLQRSYLIPKMPPAEVGKELDALLMAPPKGR